MRQQRFEDQVDEFHDRFKGYFFAKIKAGIDLNTADIQEIPRLQFEEEPLQDQVFRVLTGVLGLVLVSIFLVLSSRRKLNQIGRLAA